jgi:hypothetical protein
VRERDIYIIHTYIYIHITEDSPGDVAKSVWFPVFDLVRLLRDNNEISLRHLPLHYSPLNPTAKAPAG